jgi:anti-anti-sigma regulatory factor
VLETREGVVVRLRGEAGVAEAAFLESCLLRLAARRPASVTFDLRDLMAVSSLALGVLAGYRHAAVRARVRVCLAPDLYPGVRDALSRSDLLGLFETPGGAKPGAGPEAPAEGVQENYPNVHDVERTHGVTWFRLVELEPQVERLLWRARLAGAKWRPFMPVERIFGPVRDELAQLIGFVGKHRKHPVLGSVGAYEVAYWKLFHAVAGSLCGSPGGAAEAAAPGEEDGPARGSGT